MNPLIVTGVTIAIGYALVPGPVNAETTRRGIRDGFGPALGVQLGALAGDVPWAVLSLTGVALLLQGKLLSTVLGLMGAGFLIVLAHAAFRAALGRDTCPAATRTGRPFAVGFLFSVANPGAIGFWAGIGGGALVTSQESGTGGLWVLVCSYTVASALVGGLLAAVAARGQRWARGRAQRWVDGLGGIALTWGSVDLLRGVV